MLLGCCEAIRDEFNVNQAERVSKKLTNKSQDWTKFLLKSLLNESRAVMARPSAN